MDMHDTRNALPAGASGVLGRRHIAEALTRAGHTVTGLGRGPGADVRADLMDRDRLLSAVDGLRSTRSCTRSPPCATRRCGTGTCSPPTTCG